MDSMRITEQDEDTAGRLTWEIEFQSGRIVWVKDMGGWYSFYNIYGNAADITVSQRDTMLGMIRQHRSQHGL